jgi:putative ABC transport system permease protein
MSLPAFAQDLRHSLRALGRARATTAVLLLSLALGTGANAAVYGALNALLFSAPAGVGTPSRLVDINTSEFSGTAYGQSSYPDFLSVRSGARSFAAIAAIDDNTVENVRLGDAGQSARIAAVSDAYFAALQMTAHAGRLLAEGDTSPDPPEAVLSLRLAAALGGEAKVLGRPLTIGDRQYTVVGLAPARFQGLRAGRECDVWRLMTAPAAADALRGGKAARGDRRLSIVARLAAGVSVRDASDELRGIAEDLAARYPASNRGSIFDPEAVRLLTAVPYSRLDRDAQNQTFLIALVAGGASVLLLASACLNVGSLLLSRAVARRLELAVKVALGATRRRLVRQLLTEAVCVSLAGGVLGLLFAIWTAGAIPALFMAEQAELIDTRLDARMILLTIGVACVAGAIFGVTPALHGTSFPPVTALRADAGGVSANQGGGRLRAFLLTGQVALSTILLLGTALLITGLTRALEGALGAAAKRVAIVSIELPGRFGDPVRGVAARRRLLEHVPTLGGVEAVGWASTLPLGRGNKRPFTIQAGPGEATDTVELETNVVSPDYFRALSLPVVEGRLFDDGDTTLAPAVVVVDEIFARRYLGQKAIGRHIFTASGDELAVVGVVRSGRYRTLQQSPQPTVYFPSTQDYLWRGHLIVRTTVDPAALLRPIADVVEEVGGGATIMIDGTGKRMASTLDAYLNASLAIDRLTTTLVGVCGIVALVMSTIGVYGVMADAVLRRTKEIGLRVALGAGRLQVVRLVSAEALGLAAGGLAAGTLAAVAVSSIARAFVDGVPALEMVTLAAVGVTLTTVTALASIVPLRRALRVHPNIALRAE